MKDKPNRPVRIDAEEMIFADNQPAEFEYQAEADDYIVAPEDEWQSEVYDVSTNDHHLEDPFTNDDWEQFWAACLEVGNNNEYIAEFDSALFDQSNSLIPHIIKDDDVFPTDSRKSSSRWLNLLRQPRGP